MEAAARSLVSRRAVNLEAAYSFAIAYCGGECWPPGERNKALLRLRQKFPRRRAALESEARAFLAANPFAHRHVLPGGYVLGSWEFRGDQADHLALAHKLRESAAEFAAATMGLADLIQKAAEADDIAESRRLEPIAKRALSDMRRRRV
jgi:hypothetical protein